ncbi:site-2 protease family protein [Candidatus Dependentiae bacterium]
MEKDFLGFLADIAVIFPAFLIALSVHECSHALVAYWLGDDTAKRQGRVSLNPFAHLDFWGTIFLLIFRIGWAKPVPFNIQRFKYPRIYSVLTALAGPASNFIVALVCFVFIKFLPIFGFSHAVAISLFKLLEACAYINVMLGTFNLLPIPPLDGSHFIFALLYKKYPNVIVWLYRYSIFILLFLLFFPGTRSILIGFIHGVFNFLKNLVI